MGPINSNVENIAYIDAENKVIVKLEFGDYEVLDVNVTTGWLRVKTGQVGTRSFILTIPETQFVNSLLEQAEERKEAELDGSRSSDVRAFIAESEESVGARI